MSDTCGECGAGLPIRRKDFDALKSERDALKLQIEDLKLKMLNEISEKNIARSLLRRSEMEEAALTAKLDESNRLLSELQKKLKDHDDGCAEEWCCVRPMVHTTEKR